MFQNLVRRISGSILPRPWSSDSTSNAPTIGRKRRLSTPGEEDEGESSAKRAKGEDGIATPPREESPQHAAPVDGTKEVKEVMQGVNDVELEDEKPESVPLPASPPPEAENVEQDKMAVSPTKSPRSRKSVAAKDANVSPLSAKLILEPVTVDTSSSPEAAAPAKAPRKTRKLPSKSARPSAKVAKKDKAPESEVEVTKMDGGSA